MNAEIGTATTFAISVDTEGVLRNLDLSHESLPATRAAIGCAIAVPVQLDGNSERTRTMWVDEDAIAVGALPNPVASTIAYQIENNIGQLWYYGTAVFAASDAEGNIVGLTAAEARDIYRHAAQTGCPPQLTNSAMPEGEAELPNSFP